MLGRIGWGTVKKKNEIGEQGVQGACVTQGVREALAMNISPHFLRPSPVFSKFKSLLYERKKSPKARLARRYKAPPRTFGTPDWNQPEASWYTFSYLVTQDSAQ